MAPLPFLFFRSNFRGAPLADRALCAESRAEIGALCKAKARQATPPCAPRYPRYSAFPTVRTTRHASLPPELLSSQCRHILRASHHVARAGWTNRRVRVFGAGVHWRHPRIQSSAWTRQVRPSRWVRSSSSRGRTPCTKTGIPALSSTFAIACAIRGEVQANLRSILARPSVGDLRRLRKFYKRLNAH
jgi:hypothetical protein